MQKENSIKPKKTILSLIETNNSNSAISQIIAFYIKQDNYEKVFEYFTKYKNYQYFDDIKIHLLLYKKLNIIFKDFTLQLVDYGKYTAIEHIIDKHSHEFNQNRLIINDVYNIPYPGIGNNTDILRVFTIPNSNEILTMFPLGRINEYEEKQYTHKLK